LFPGEKLVGKVSPLQVVQPNTALKLKSIRDFKDEEGNARKAGDEWLFKGPGTYIPRREVQVVEIIRAYIIKENQALRIRAKTPTKDANGVQRSAGEEWLIKTTGSYLPSVDEEVVDTVNAHVLTEKKALHLRATKTFTDVFGKHRKAGEEWVVTMNDAETHIPDVYEQVVGDVKLTSLSSQQYCIVLEPWKNGKNQLGTRELRRGETAFFLQPGERLESGIQAAFILEEDGALLLKAKEGFMDGKTTRQAGEM
jgi:major vault protein